jgi:N-acylneuraminate cytidylyltransferase
MTYSRLPWTAVIPLRAGSKGLPGKNTRGLAGKPLYRHAVDLALAAGASRVILSTDIPELLTAAVPPGVQTLERPADLCGDAVPMAPVLMQALQATKCAGTVVLLQATSPLRQVDDVSAALALFETGQFELVMTVTDADRGVLKWGRTEGERFVPLSDPAHCFSNRQSLPPVVRPNGAVYVMNAQWLLAHGSFVSDRIGCVQMSPERSLDIDTLADFERCEVALSAHPTRQQGSK